MIVEEVKDIDIIKKLMKPHLSEISSDNDNHENFTPKIDNGSIWVIVKNYGNIEGIALIERQTTTSLMIHPYLVGSAGKGRRMIKSLIKFLMVSSEKINTSIPVIFQKTINMALKIGFKKEGVNRSSFLKNGEHHDQIYFGITKQEVKLWDL